MVTSGTANDEWTLEVGHGEAEFLPLGEGSRVAKVKGIQGGHHVPVTARLRGPDVREELESSTYGTAYGAPYASATIEVEVVVGGALESRSVATSTASGTDDTSADFLYLNAYVGEDARGDATITVKVANEDKTKWASSSRRVVIE